MLPLRRSDDSNSRQFSEFGLERDHPTRRADQARGEEGVVPEIGSHVDHGHSGSAVPLEHPREMRLVAPRPQARRHCSVSGVAEELDPTDRTALGVNLGQLNQECRWCDLVLNRAEHLSHGGDLGQVTRPGCVDRPAELLGQRRVDQTHQLIEGEPSFGKGAPQPLDETIAPRGPCWRACVSVVVRLVHARPTVPRAPAQAGVLPRSGTARNRPQALTGSCRYSRSCKKVVTIEVDPSAR